MHIVARFVQSIVSMHGAAEPSRPGMRAARAAVAGAVVALCLSCVGAAHADGVALVAGASSEASIVGVAWALRAPNALAEWPAARLFWGIEADALNIHSRRGRPIGAADIATIGATPNLRVEWTQQRLAPYAELGIGAHFLSHTSLRGGPHLGTAFQFGEWLGAGLRFGVRRALELGLRVEHISNADIKLPNDGITFVVARFGWEF